MAKKQIQTISQDKMRRFVRLEEPLTKLIGKKMPEQIVAEDGYNFTLDDLSALLENLKASDLTVDQFENSWAKPLRKLFKDTTDYTIYTAERPDRPVLPDTDEKVIAMILDRLDNAWIECDDENKKIAEQVDLAFLQDLMAKYQENKGKPETQREYPEAVKLQYVKHYADPANMQKLDAAGRTLYAKFTNELADRDVKEALQAQAGGFYGGNAVFPCDWHMAEKALLRLYELDPSNSRVADLLGYIYYYGRTNGGVPDYSRAFYYFTIAASNGDMEALYKMADCFHKGNGVEVNDQTAFKLNDIAYETTFGQFTKGDTDCPFADAARRKGNCYLRGIGVKKDTLEAYRHYLMADLAIRMRVENGAHFGDDSVQAKIVNALAKTKETLIASGEFSAKDFAKRRIKSSYPLGIHEALKDGYACEIKVTRKDSGKVLNLVLHRVRKHNDRTPAKMLLAVPQFADCYLSDEIEWRLKDCEKCDITGNKDKFRFNAWEYDAQRKQVWFFYDDRLTASFTGGTYIIKNPNTEENTFFM